VSAVATPVDMRRRRRVGSNFSVLFLLVFLVYFLLPLFWLVISATKTNSQLFDSFGLWLASGFNLFSNLRDTFTYDEGIYVRWLANTAYYSVTSAAGAALISTTAGYAFAKFKFRGRGLTFAVILGAIMVPQTALVIPTYLLLSKVGVINSPLAVILPSLVNPLGVYLMRVYSEQAVPDELLDAARVDGAGEWRTFLSVAFRILAPGFVTVLLLSFVATWNNYFLPLTVLSDPKLYPVTVGLANWNNIAAASGAAQALFTLVITGALVAIVPLILAFLLLQRYWQGGLTFGGLGS
jgi:multiple sugar transport system permease protein